MDIHPRILRLSFAYVNAYLVVSERPVLVDTGPPRSFRKLLQVIRRLGVDPAKISAVLLTHGHNDHAGNAAELKARFGIPVFAHAGDLEKLRTGSDGELLVRSPFPRWLPRLLSKPFAPVEADGELRDGEPLDRYGLPGKVIHVPGHSPGSVAFIVGDQCIAGDAISASPVHSGRPIAPIFADRGGFDGQMLSASIGRLFSSGAQVIFPGHGAEVLVSHLADAATTAMPSVVDRYRAAM